MVFVVTLVLALNMADCFSGDRGVHSDFIYCVVVVLYRVRRGIVHLAYTPHSAVSFVSSPVYLSPWSEVLNIGSRLKSVDFSRLVWRNNRIKFLTSNLNAIFFSLFYSHRLSRSSCSSLNFQIAIVVCAIAKCVRACVLASVVYVY